MVSTGFKTDQGKRRDNNEDALFVLPEQQFYIIADGVGGHNSGELASRMAVGNLAEYVAEHPLDQVEDEGALMEYFSSALSGANRLIYEKARSNPENAGMATTVVMAYIRKDKIYIANVGDSRAYLIREGELRQITEDHTYVHQLLLAGSITKEQAAVHPKRNMITRAVGGDKTVLPDYFQLAALPGDIFLLCTDGLFGEIPDDELCRMALSADSMHDLAAEFVTEANRRGGKDNISVICIKI